MIDETDFYMEAYEGASHEVKALAAGQGVRRRKDMSQDEKRAHDRRNEQRRKSIARARDKAMQRQADQDAKPVGDPRRMTASLVIMGHLRLMLSRIVVARYNKVRRTLGDVSVDDIASDALIGCAEGIAKQEWYDLVELLAAAKWVSEQPGIPDVVDKEAPKGAKWLMSVMSRQVRNHITNAYRSSVVSTTIVDDDGTERRVDNTLESLEYLDTALANMGGVDTMIARFQADRSPIFGWRDPGVHDRRRFAMIAIDSALEARDLGWLADIMLNDENIRTDGTAKWSEIAEPVWKQLREQCFLPELPTDNPKFRVELIKRAVRRIFDFYPEVVSAAYQVTGDPISLERREYVPTATIEPAEGVQGEPYAGTSGNAMVGVGRLEEILGEQERNARYVLSNSGIKVKPFQRDYETVRSEVLRALGMVRNAVSETELV
jgi:hypothetical protein